ncbi:MAG: cell division protein ZapA [Lachnospiraceae bacterium]|nr:cell division protein ZapA [Lachnospiraceae bacterium]
MSAKKSAEVLIGGKVYTLSGYEEEDYLQKVAAYINNKIAEFNSMDELRTYPADMKATLVELNIADDYFKAKALVEKYESDMEQKDKELYDLKHDLISDQVRVEALEEQVRNLENEKKDLLLAKAKLEASLEDALLGSLDVADDASNF